jgi:hypothetical protein
MSCGPRSPLLTVATCFNTVLSLPYLYLIAICTFGPRPPGPGRRAWSADQVSNPYGSVCIGTPWSMLSYVLLCAP